MMTEGSNEGHKSFLGDYTPTQDAMRINRERIALRLSEMAVKAAARKEKK